MSTVTLSSIALLQERFRQLEKMKEMRQEKALLRLLSESENRYSPPPPTTTVHYEQVYNYKSCFSAEKMMFVPKPDCQLSLSLFPVNDSQIKSPSFHGTRDVPCGTISWPLVDTAPSGCSSTIKIDHSDSDIDTSLHL